MIDTRTFELEIDPSDRIVRVNQAWADFARENGAPDLASKVIGTSFLSHVAGESVAALLRLLLARVRRSRGAVRFPFRCDSPSVRRHMEMTCRCLEGGSIAFSSRTVALEPRPPVALPEVRPDEGAPPVIACAWCKRFKTPAAWLEVEDAIRALRLFGDRAGWQVSHGICPDCAESFDAGPAHPAGEQRGPPRPSLAAPTPNPSGSPSRSPT